MAASDILRGKAWKYGDNIDTDAIIPARYLTSSDPEFLARHCMEDADTEFVNKARTGDFIVAGKNFGCGSSREHAPAALKAAGISCIIARSFARIFYRNSFNRGLPILDCPEAVDGISDGDEIEVDLSKGLIRNLTSGAEFRANPIPPFMQELVDAGGLIGYVRRRIARTASRNGRVDPCTG
ncbi:MAG: 3-isopropylmalate dehydratase small subunit [Candidatus Hydrogenedentota bacterium]|nr:MAG: 3-isopropylmalate dehydratase small subunit [Candidatus Hydrogenedentota bacterium]